MQLNRPSSLVIFVAILMLCGEVIATPLMLCRNMFTASVNEMPQSPISPEHHCEGMAMELLDKGEEGGLVGETAGLIPNSHDTWSELMQDCDYLCQLYRGIPSLEVSDSLFMLSSVLLRYGDGYLSHFVTSPIEVHFRPPINT